MSQKRPYDHRDDVSVEESPLKRRVLFKQDAPKDTEARVVCAMDFGTAFTGYAFAFTNDPGANTRTALHFSDGRILQHSHNDGSKFTLAVKSSVLLFCHAISETCTQQISFRAILTGAPVQIQKHVCSAKRQAGCSLTLHTL